MKQRSQLLSSLPHTLQGRKTYLRASSLSSSITSAMNISQIGVWPPPLLGHCVCSLSHRMTAGVCSPCAMSVRTCDTAETLPSEEVGSSEAWETAPRSLLLGNKSDSQPSSEATNFLYPWSVWSSQEHPPGQQTSRLNGFAGNQESQQALHAC